MQEAGEKIAELRDETKPKCAVQKWFFLVESDANIGFRDDRNGTIPDSISALSKYDEFAFNLYGSFVT